MAFVVNEPKQYLFSTYHVVFRIVYLLVSAHSVYLVIEWEIALPIEVKSKVVSKRAIHITIRDIVWTHSRRLGSVYTSWAPRIIFSCMPNNLYINFKHIARWLRVEKLCVAVSARETVCECA